MDTDDYVAKIYEWSERIHGLAVEKGWWDGGERDVAEVVANFHGEVSEAWEEYRACRMHLWFTKPGTTMPNELWVSMGFDPMELVVDHGWKPEGFWVEIGDLCIRLMDAICAYGWDAQVFEMPVVKSIPILICDFHQIIGNVSSDNEWYQSVGYVAFGLVARSIQEAEAVSVDLWELIELKHKYNETRPYRHGGKKA